MIKELGTGFFAQFPERENKLFRYFLLHKFTLNKIFSYGGSNFLKSQEIRKVTGTP